MSTSLRKISVVPLLIVVGMLLITAWFFPSLGGMLGIMVLVGGFLVNVFVLIKRHRAEYLQGAISRSVYIRKVLVESLGILLAMILSVLVAARVVHIATQHMADMIVRFIAEVFIAFLVGISVGFVFKKLWDGIRRRYSREPQA